MTLTEKKLLLDFFNQILEEEQAGVKSLNDILPEITDENLKAIILSFIRDENMNCQILNSLITNLGEIPGNNTRDFIWEVKDLCLIREKLKHFMERQEWVAKQIRYHRGLLDLTSSRIYMEAMKIQHEENIDLMSKVLLSVNI
jgi:hypothetical protein